MIQSHCCPELCCRGHLLSGVILLYGGTLQPGEATACRQVREPPLGSVTLGLKTLLKIRESGDCSCVSCAPNSAAEEVGGGRSGHRVLLLCCVEAARQ